MLVTLLLHKKEISHNLSGKLLVPYAHLQIKDFLTVLSTKHTRGSTPSPWTYTFSCHTRISQWGTCLKTT